MDPLGDEQDRYNSDQCIPYLRTGRRLSENKKNHRVLDQIQLITALSQPRQRRAVQKTSKGEAFVGAQADQPASHQGGGNEDQTISQDVLTICNKIKQQKASQQQKESGCFHEAVFSLDHPGPLRTQPQQPSDQQGKYPGVGAIIEAGLVSLRLEHQKHCRH